jgi:hypothetical protein
MDGILRGEKGGSIRARGPPRQRARKEKPAEAGFKGSQVPLFSRAL